MSKSVKLCHPKKLAITKTVSKPVPCMAVSQIGQEVLEAVVGWESPMGRPFSSESGLAPAISFGI